MPTSDRWPPGSEDFRQFLRDRETALIARAREAGFFHHRPTSGVARERVLHEPLHEILPARYALTSGVVKDSAGATSTQWDILIYDRMDAPVLYRSGEAAVLPIESVLAGITVKTNVDKAAVYDAASAAGQLRGMVRRYVGQRAERARTPDVYLFGFQGSELNTVREHVMHACENPSSLKVLSGVAVLGAGLVLPSNSEGRVGSLDEIERYDIAYSRDGAFGIFVGLLWAGLVRVPRGAPNLLSYMRMGELLDPPYRTPGFEHSDSEGAGAPSPSNAVRSRVVGASRETASTIAFHAARDSGRHAALAWPRCSLSVQGRLGKRGVRVDVVVGRGSDL